MNWRRSPRREWEEVRVQLAQLPLTSLAQGWAQAAVICSRSLIADSQSPKHVWQRRWPVGRTNP
jgi:hypothetical protein